jgi:hypothetical protein
MQQRLRCQHVSHTGACPGWQVRLQAAAAGMDNKSTAQHSKTSADVITTSAVHVFTLQLNSACLDVAA